MNALNYDPTWRETLQTQFMHNAFVAGILISIAAASIGYFTIVRNSTFGAHALAHIGLPGATGAVLLGFPVYAGMGIFAFAAALVIGFLGKKNFSERNRHGNGSGFCNRLRSSVFEYVERSFKADAVDSFRLYYFCHESAD